MQGDRSRERKTGGVPRLRGVFAGVKDAAHTPLTMLQNE